MRETSTSRVCPTLGHLVASQNQSAARDTTLYRAQPRASGGSGEMNRVDTIDSTMTGPLLEPGYVQSISGSSFSSKSLVRRKHLHSGALVLLIALTVGDIVLGAILFDKFGVTRSKAHACRGVGVRER